MSKKPPRVKNESLMQNSSIREELGLSQEQLAELSSVSRATISDAESYGKSISISNVIRIADALHCSIDNLYNRETFTKYTYNKPGLLCLTMDDLTNARITPTGEILDKWDHKKKMGLYRLDQDFDGGNHYIAIYQNEKNDKNDPDIIVVDTLWRRYINEKMKRPYECLIKIKDKAYWTKIGLLRNISSKYQSKQYFFYDNVNNVVLVNDEELRNKIVGVAIQKIIRCTADDDIEPIELLDVVKAKKRKTLFEGDGLNPQEEFNLVNTVDLQEEEDIATGRIKYPPKKRKKK